MTTATDEQIARAVLLQDQLRTAASFVRAGCLIGNYDRAACENVAFEIDKYASGGLDRAITAAMGGAADGLDRLATAADAAERILDAARAFAEEAATSWIDNAAQTARDIVEDARAAGAAVLDAAPAFAVGAVALLALWFFLR